MVEVRLHGELAKEFGKVWHLNIATPREAVQAIQANTGRFVAKIRDLERRGMVFRVRTKDHDYDNDDVGTTLGNVKRVDFIPIVEGASAGVRFVIGAVLVAYGTFGAAYGGSTLDGADRLHAHDRFCDRMAHTSSASRRRD